MATSGKSTTSARGWKKVSPFEDVELPSGNVARIRRVGLPELMASGVVPDTLTGIAQSHVDKAKGKKAKQVDESALMQDVMKDKKKLSDMMDLFDKATVLCVQEPKVLYYKDDSGEVLDDAEREQAAQKAGFDHAEDVLFSDEVDQMDKMFIFNFVAGGTRDLESFREQYGESLAGLERGSNVEVPS